MLPIFSIIYCLFSGGCEVSPCSGQTVTEKRYTICQFDINQVSLKMYLNDKNGKPYGSFFALQKELAGSGRSLQFAMNGGMYHSNLSPVGLYIENGVEKKKVSTKGGFGNFHLLPNGIFFVDKDRAGVLETRQFLAAGKKPQFATQSGPMLVIDGKLHKRFLEKSDSFKIRNGVGVSGDGKTVYLVISHAPVRFWDFGELFRSYLKTPNALFLDGSISSLYTPQILRGGFAPVGPVIAVVK